MLSDERIRQIAEDIYCSEGTRAEIEHSIRAALAEAAVCSQFKPGESGQVWEAAQVPVVGPTHTMDAQVWAQKWLEITKDKPEIASDEGAMIGWFANAIMAGYDNAMLRSNTQVQP